MTGDLISLCMLVKPVCWMRETLSHMRRSKTEWARARLRQPEFVCLKVAMQALKTMTTVAAAVKTAGDKDVSVGIEETQCGGVRDVLAEVGIAAEATAAVVGILTAKVVQPEAMDPAIAAAVRATVMDVAAVDTKSIVNTEGALDFLNSKTALLTQMSCTRIADMRSCCPLSRWTLLAGHVEGTFNRMVALARYPGSRAYSTKFSWTVCSWDLPPISMGVSQTG